MAPFVWRHVVGDALVALGAEADRPFDGRAGADAGLPFRTDLGKVVGEDEGRPRTVRAMHDDDRLRRQLDVRVELRDRRIVPLGDLAEEDVRQRRPVEDELVRADAVEIDDWHVAADDRRELHQARSRQILRLERHVRGAESDGLRLDLLDAAAGADRLIVEAIAGVRLIGVGPFGVDRIGESRAGAGNVAGPGAAYARRDDRRAHQGSNKH